MSDDEADLRLARESDLVQLREVTDAAYSKYLERMDRPPAPMLRDLLPRVHSGQVWVTGDPIVGLICLTATKDAVLVENVAVHPSAQGTGLGRMLMEFAEDEARRLGRSRLELHANEVMAENVAIYSHLGHREIDRRSDDGYQRVFMEKTLPPSS